MPLISAFYGILIRMYFQQSEHNPPHIHAYYGEYVAAISIADRRILDGSLPPKAFALVCEWICGNGDELMRMWNTQVFKKLPPLE